VGTVANSAGFWRRLAGSIVDGIVVGIVETALRVALGGAGAGLGAVVSFGYYTWFHGRTGQTPGNAVFGIRVLDVDTGEVIGYGRAFVRCLVSIVSALVFLLGYLWMLWDGRDQTWHDKAAHSLPVHVGR
jgi:uncharacterized RDD family membrane protein YckC